MAVGVRLMSCCKTILPTTTVRLIIWSRLIRVNDEHFDGIGLFLQEIQDGKNKQEN
jgi:hypothetical protein